MRAVMICLLVLLAVLQYRLWFGQGSYVQAWMLRQQLENQALKNTELQERNSILDAEVTDLKTGHKAVEEQARSDLGMVKSNETFYQVVHPHNNVVDDNSQKK